MHVVESKVILLAETRIIPLGDHKFREAYGVPKEFKSDAMNEGEELAEIMGRMCYKSFGLGLNANLTKVREGNKEYIENILKQKHGSVMEHSYTTVVFLNVSRILTHELVRHRAGMGFSQESMRFVRLDDIPMYIPNLTHAFKELEPYMEGLNTGPEWAAAWNLKYAHAMESVANYAQDKIEEFITLLDKPKVPFHVKKTITSALRRMAPSGHTTHIGVTANHRAWRYVLGARTSPGAEEEINHVMTELGGMMKRRYENFYQDMSVTLDGNGYGQCVFLHDKV